MLHGHETFYHASFNKHHNLNIHNLCPITAKQQPSRLKNEANADTSFITRRF